MQKKYEQNASNKRTNWIHWGFFNMYVVTLFHCMINLYLIFDLSNFVNCLININPFGHVPRHISHISHDFKKQNLIQNCGK